MPNTYRSIQGDTWDKISLAVYGDEKYLDILITANWRERFRMIFPAGIILTVPDIDQQIQNERNLPPWRKTT